MSGYFQHLQSEIAEIDDPEIRARTRREWGLVGIDEDGCAGLLGEVDGAGPDASMNGAIAGRTWPDFYAGDATALAAEVAADKRRARASQYLTRADVKEVFDAVSFAVQETGVLFNSQITIAYRYLGVEDDRIATVLLSDYLRELRMRMKAWGFRFDYAYVHERSKERGFHTHVISALPAHLRDRIREWTGKFFSHRYPELFVPEAVKVQVSGVRSPHHKLELHRHRLTYITKGLDPYIRDRDDERKLMPLIELIGVPEKFQRPAGAIDCVQRCGTSHSIGPAARRLEPDFVSVFGLKQWARLHSGWEADEYPRRMERREIERIMGNLDI